MSFTFIMSQSVWIPKPSVKPKMCAFVVPPVLPRAQSSARANRLCVRCALIKGGMGGRRRLQASRLQNADTLRHLPPQFFNEVRRFVRSRAFVDEVRETLNWPYTRFTGLIFQRLPISAETTDGVPEHLRKFQKRADYKFIDIPRGVLLRAKERAGAPVDTEEMRLCALFETYGIDAEEFQESQRKLGESEEDLQKQIRAWTDVGQSMRTETDQWNLKGGEIFEEDLMDFLE